MPNRGLLTSRYMKLLKLINDNGGVPCEDYPQLFYPEDISDPQRREAATRAAKRICKTCPIMEQCFTYALETHQRYGIWGATSPDER